MRFTALLITLALFCAVIAGFRGEWDGVSVLALIFAFAALCIAPLERRKQ
ncbi:hypothetical protein FB385_2687 [Paramicrobacterium agarici]|nr:hypothetical protein FB385_2687 [Microbacterium agarici]